MDPTQEALLKMIDPHHQVHISLYPDELRAALKCLRADPQHRSASYTTKLGAALARDEEETRAKGEVRKIGGMLQRGSINLHLHQERKGIASIIEWITRQLPAAQAEEINALANDGDVVGALTRCGYIVTTLDQHRVAVNLNLEAGAALYAAQQYHLLHLADYGDGDQTAQNGGQGGIWAGRLNPDGTKRFPDWNDNGEGDYADEDGDEDNADEDELD
jgi:hypothetical protein